MIIRVTKGTDPYVRIDKVPINDKRLTWKARGLLVYLLSKPNDWKVIIEDLINQSPQGESAVRGALHELEEIGYLQKDITRKNGKITGNSYTVRERPEKTPFGENLHPEKLNLENPALLTNKTALTNDTPKDSMVEKADPAIKVLKYLNGKSVTPFPLSKTNLKGIHGRIKDGATVEELELVIDFKAAAWQNDERMWEYLRPKTLFGPDNFVGYLTGAKGWVKQGKPALRKNKNKKPAAFVDDRRNELVRELNDRLTRKRS